MNPALVQPQGGMVGSGNMGRGPRDRLIGVTVTVVKGPYKGYVGAIKDTNGPIARVELHTGNKVVAVDKEKLKRRLCVCPRCWCFCRSTLTQGQRETCRSRRWLWRQQIRNSAISISTRIWSRKWTDPRLEWGPYAGLGLGTYPCVEHFTNSKSIRPRSRWEDSGMEYELQNTEPVCGWWPNPGLECQFLEHTEPLRYS